MTPLQYIIAPSDVAPALLAGCRWMQMDEAAAHTISDDDFKALIAECHSSCCYMLLTDDYERCLAVQADGVVLSAAQIERIAAAIPPPSGTILQCPRPVTQAIAQVRRTLGEDSPMLLGAYVSTAEDAVAAARSGADFIQVPAINAAALSAAVRERSFTTPVVACGVADADEIPSLLDAGINGVACHSRQVPPVLIPSLLNADEQ